MDPQVDHSWRRRVYCRHLAVENLCRTMDQWYIPGHESSSQSSTGPITQLQGSAPVVPFDME